jgi:C1A family cysteine protease
MPDRRLLSNEQIPEDLQQYKPHLLGFEPKDLRDIPASALDGAKAETLPRRVMLPKVTPVRDQGAIGSCVGFAVTAMLENLAYRRTWQAAQLSAFYAYFVGRVIDGSWPHDAGTYVRSVLKGIQKFGVSPEPLWPYNGYDTFKMKEAPDQFAQLQGSFHRGYTYVKLETLDALRSSIAQGYGFCGIFYLYENMYQYEQRMSGDVQMPAEHEGIRGAHSCFFLGYDDDLQRLYFKNSWSRNWGNGGYGSIPYAFFTGDEITTSLNDTWSVRPV